MGAANTAGAVLNMNDTARRIAISFLFMVKTSVLKCVIFVDEDIISPKTTKQIQYICYISGTVSRNSRIYGNAAPIVILCEGILLNSI